MLSMSKEADAASNIQTRKEVNKNERKPQYHHCCKKLLKLNK